ncbi:hypothetical protein NLI96_g12076 [Meripilus lineatus]|uniref:Uncharacterized protein n=1 Tax=Meripilus lineatus TaxID=2056292 RepID=A0AAD5UQR5_9APHY|nr:hypothetical protein NLI96_g12076 [Physisporinus lineatus]
MSKAPSSLAHTNRTDRVTAPISDTTRAVVDFLSFMDSECMRNGRPQDPIRFRELMGLSDAGCLSRIDLFHQVASLFLWNPDILRRFNPLAPPGYSFDMEQDEKSVYGNIFMYTPGSRTLYGHFAILNGKPQIEEEEVTELMYPTEEELEAYRAEKRAATSFVPAQFPDSPDADSTGASTGSSATTIPAVVAQETGFKSADEITVTLAKNFFQKVQEKWDTPSNQAKFNEFIRIFSSPAEYKCIHMPTVTQELFSNDPDLLAEMSHISSNFRILRALENTISRWQIQSGRAIPPGTRKRKSRATDAQDVDPHLNPEMNPPHLIFRFHALVPWIPKYFLPTRSTSILPPALFRPQILGPSPLGA